MRTSTNDGHFHFYSPDEDYTKPAGDPPHVHEIHRNKRQAKKSGAAVSPVSLMRIDGHKHNLASYADEVAAEQKAKDAAKEAEKAKKKEPRDGPPNMDGDVIVYRPVE